MRNLFSLLLLAAVIMATGCNSSKATAQTAAPQQSTANQQGPRQGGARQGAPDLTAMISQLGLTEKQAETFKAVKDKYATQAQEMRKTAGSDRQAMRTKMESLRANEDKEVNAILTAEQQQAYAKIMKEQEAARRERGGRSGGQGRPGGGRPGGGV
jgi:Spy/CpxP family protein refolding chaperone